MSSSGRPCISINGAVGVRLAAWCEANGRSMASVLELLIAEVVSGQVAIPAAALERGRKGSRFTGSLAHLATPDQAAAALREIERRQRAAGNAAIMAAVAAAPPQAALSAFVEMRLSPHLVEAIGDQIDRALTHGVDLTPGDVLDAALVRMLDVLERVLWCRTCHESSEHCRCSGRARRVA